MGCAGSALRWTAACCAALSTLCLGHTLGSLATYSTVPAVALEAETTIMRVSHSTAELTSTASSCCIEHEYFAACLAGTALLLSIRVYAAYLEGNKRLRLSQHIMHSAPISRPANTQPTATPAACPLLRPSLSVEGPACSEKGQHVTTAFSIWQLLVFTSEQCAELCDHAWPRVCLMPSSMLQTH